MKTRRYSGNNPSTGIPVVQAIVPARYMKNVCQITINEYLADLKEITLKDVNDAVNKRMMESGQNLVDKGLSIKIYGKANQNLLTVLSKAGYEVMVTENAIIIEPKHRD